MGMTSFLILCLLNFMIALLSCSENGPDVDKLCNATNTERVQYDFSSDTVGNEHIITFKGYFSKITRQNYVTAALKNAGVSNWTILQRENPAKEFPSDFDVILLGDSGKAALEALKDHPAIRRVTAQRIVQRTIKYVREIPEYSTEEEALGEPETFLVENTIATKK